MSVLISGGAGYIGSHTIIELIEQGYKDIVSVDNYSNSTKDTYRRIKEITSVDVKFYSVDLKDLDSCRKIFEENNIESIIHFAAFKSVPESVNNPLLYFKNNINSLLNLLECARDYKVSYFIFSSSCSVYGNAEKLPVTEETPLQEAESPYARTKVMGERIIKDFINAYPDIKSIILRYFNPVGAHISGLNGELPTESPDNLVPYITQTAAGIRDCLSIYGGDYNTIDGTCIRDYIHVSDIANAHILSIDYLKKTDSTLDIFNLGTGNGISVLEVVKTFENVNQIKLNYKIVNRRKGDVEVIYANNNKAKDKLKWIPKNNLNQMMKSAWKWQLTLNSES